LLRRFDMRKTFNEASCCAIALVGALVAFGAAGDARAQPTIEAMPPVPFPVENPFSEEKRVLGKVLFWDEQLSSDNTMACATCHMPESGGTDARLGRNPGPDGLFFTADDIFGSPGVIRSDAADDYVPEATYGFGRQTTGRTAPSAIGAAFAPDLFWDGRARSEFVDPQTGLVSIASGGALESQVVGPPRSPVEMAHEGRVWGQVTGKIAGAVPLSLATNLPADVAVAIQSARSYPALFEDAFGDPAVTAERIAYAIATYERTLVADQTPWDQFMAGQASALTSKQKLGWQAFQASRCISCHTAPLFTDQQFRNIGVRPVQEDVGRMAVTGNTADRGKFKVPTLRNVGLKSSFMHNGDQKSLVEVMAFYTNDPSFPFFPENRDPLMALVNVPPQLVSAVQDFMEFGLTDPRVAQGLFPFDHPTLYSQRGNPNRAIVGPATSGSGGVQPKVIANVPPNIGNRDFKIGVHSGLGGATANVYLSRNAPVGGVVSPDEVLGPIVLGGTGVGGGFGTLHWPIPSDPGLDGTFVYMQWVIADPGGAGGVAQSEAVAFEFFCSELGCISNCYADCDQSTGAGVLDVFDFLCFQNSFVSAQAYACDCDTSTGAGVCDVFDFLCFQNAFVAGCP
jgi:cytochrome c peroxidase